VKNAAILLISAALAATGGCIPSYPLAEGDLDRYWLLSDVSARRAEAEAGSKIPTRWVIRQQADASRVSLAGAMEKLQAGADEVEFAVSPAQADEIAGLFRQVREAMKEMKEIVESSGRADKNRWARTLAGALATVESVSRSASGEAGGEGDQPLGRAAGPIMEMIAGLLEKRSDEPLLGDLSGAELQQLRDLLAQVILKTGFEVAGKDLPAGLRRTVAGLMRQSKQPAALKAPLEKLLTDQLSQAPPAPARQSKREAVRTALSVAPRAIRLLEAFLGQWDRFDHITVEMLRRGDASAVGVTLAVLPGKEARIADVVTGMPAIVFRGTTRVVAQPDATGAGETTVSFDPVGEGAVELRYEGIIYGLVRLFALPLASGPLREVRVSARTAARGEQLINVAMMSEATDDEEDPRRMLVVQDARTKQTVRGLFAVQSVAVQSETTVSYLTPKRRYTYQRIKQTRPE